MRDDVFISIEYALCALVAIHALYLVIKKRPRFVVVMTLAFAVLPGFLASLFSYNLAMALANYNPGNQPQTFNPVLDLLSLFVPFWCVFILYAIANAKPKAATNKLTAE